MKKIILSVGFMVAFIAYAVYQQFNENQKSNLKISTDNKSSDLTIINPRGRGLKNGFGMMNGGAMIQGRYKDGEFIGDSVDASYGNVQVKAIIKAGKITDVQFLSHPDGALNSVKINTRAMPLLTQEVIQAQSENVDTVSGASYTSKAFKESLNSALAQAK